MMGAKKYINECFYPTRFDNLNLVIMVECCSIILTRYKRGKLDNMIKCIYQLAQDATPAPSIIFIGFQVVSHRI